MHDPACRLPSHVEPVAVLPSGVTIQRDLKGSQSGQRLNH
jgi:hypothetical protein